MGGKCTLDTIPLLLSNNFPFSISKTDVIWALIFISGSAQRPCRFKSNNPGRFSSITFDNFLLLFECEYVSIDMIIKVYR